MMDIDPYALYDILCAKYGGENFANLEFFEEWGDALNYGLSNARDREEHQRWVDAFDPEETFGPYRWEWRPQPPWKTIENYNMTHYRGRARQLRAEEFWGTNMLNATTKTPLLELYAQMESVMNGKDGPKRTL